MLCLQRGPLGLLFVRTGWDPRDGKEAVACGLSQHEPREIQPPKAPRPSVLCKALAKP